MLSTVAAYGAESRIESRFAAAGPQETFEDLDLALLDALGVVVEIARGAVLFHEGDAAGAYFKVVSGAIRSSRLLADGRRHIGDFFLPGDFIGLTALATYPLTAEAVSGGTLVRYARESVEALIGRRPRIGKCLLARVCRELSDAQERVMMLARMSAQERIASFLLRLSARIGGGAGDRVSLPMTRADIGDYLGLTTETVCRALTQLKSDGVIAARGPHELRLVRRDRLARLAEGA